MWVVSQTCLWPQNPAWFHLDRSTSPLFIKHQNQIPNWITLVTGPTNCIKVEIPIPLLVYLTKMVLFMSLTSDLTKLQSTNLKSINETYSLPTYTILYLLYFSWCIFTWNQHHLATHDTIFFSPSISSPGDVEQDRLPWSLWTRSVTIDRVDRAPVAIRSPCWEKTLYLATSGDGSIFVNVASFENRLLY